MLPLFCQNGPTQFVSGSKLPLPEEKHEEALNSVPDHAHNEQPDSDSDFETLDFPEVPKVTVRPSASAASAPEMLPIPAAVQRGIEHEPSDLSATSENVAQGSHLENEDVTAEKPVATKNEAANIILGAKEEKQFLPFISPPSSKCSKSSIFSI